MRRSLFFCKILRALERREGGIKCVSATEKARKCGVGHAKARAKERMGWFTMTTRASLYCLSFCELRDLFVNRATSTFTTSTWAIDFAYRATLCDTPIIMRAAICKGPGFRIRKPRSPGGLPHHSRTLLAIAHRKVPWYRTGNNPGPDAKAGI